MEMPSSVPNQPRTLVEHQTLFTWLMVGDLLPWAFREGYRLVPREWGVAHDRIAIVSSDSGHNKFLQKVGDAVHKVGSTHYNGLAVDAQLYLLEDGVWVHKPVRCPEWDRVGQRWQSLHPLCHWGGDWDKDMVIGEKGEFDYNHLSITYGGMK